MARKILLVVVLGVAAVSLGAGSVFVIDQWYWQDQLKVQLAEKDRLIADLHKDLDDLRTGLGTLQQTNMAMRNLIDASLKDSGEVARSNKSSVEKLRAIIVRLEQLQTNAQSQNAADHQITEGKEQIQGADVLVVGCKYPTTPASGSVAVVVVCVFMVSENCAHGGFLFD